MQVMDLFIQHDAHVYILIFRAKCNEISYRTLGDHNQGAGVQVHQGGEGVHHVGAVFVNFE